MENSNVVLDAEVARQQLAERITRARAPRIPSTTYRSLLVQRMRRVASRLDS
ncbi:hypothetical protein [Nocardioides sp. T2.26MG-1]|uniref:hypothetical protein n=1 Tax=Nocardioides sp. T2.26MG-1 TaxID=3041166 RepID=UPI0024778D6F|nr:hypothetical protein [Nocardioides sp. T2.26MG-1]CAI9412007.1 hypothetical protein HIDPHFAB_01661 [Nocardioides sp. T2.26MG-1]